MLSPGLITTVPGAAHEQTGSIYGSIYWLCKHKGNALVEHVRSVQPEGQVHDVLPTVHLPPFLHFVFVQNTLVGFTVLEGVGDCVGEGVLHVRPLYPSTHAHFVSPILQEPPFLHFVAVQNTDVGVGVGDTVAAAISRTYRKAIAPTLIAPLNNRMSKVDTSRLSVRCQLVTIFTNKFATTTLLSQG